MQLKETSVEKSINQQIDHLCDQFEQELRSGKSPRIEAYLQEISAEHQESLLQHLLTQELEYKKTKLLQPDISVVIDRFPDFKSTVTHCFTNSQAGGKTVLNGESSIRSKIDSGTPLGNYSIVRELGAGGFGCVYLARDPSGSEYAIKVLHADVQRERIYVDGFAREAQRLASLSHPNIVKFVETFQTDSKQLCVVTEFAEGGPLSNRIRRSGAKAEQWEPIAAARCIAQLASALDTIHEAGLVHRDIKPDNILFDSAGTPKLADVGLALDEADYGQGHKSITGTYAYLSPEAARGESHLVDQRADIYSLGLVLYEMLTARRGFSAETREELLRRVIEIPLRPVRGLNSSVSAELERICHKATAKNPEQRYFTGGDLAEDLQQWIAKQKPNENRVFKFAAIGVLAVGSLGAVVGISSQYLWIKETAVNSAALAPRNTPIEILEFRVEAETEYQYEEVEYLAEKFQIAPGSGDLIRFSARLNRPAFVKLLWVDANGKPVQFYPVGPNGIRYGPYRTATFEFRDGFALEPEGYSESAFLLVSEEPFETLDLSHSEMERVGNLKLTRVMRYRATRGQIETVSDSVSFRSLSGSAVNVKDPTLDLLERLSSSIELIEAIRIPLDHKPPAMIDE